MASDYYSILGVTPAAEDVVIRAAYRALMRHYHPDTNPDPEAQERAREITAAFSVLRDPAKRAEYDAHRAGDDLWFPQHLRMPPDRAPRPAMRGAGIASAALALALVVTVWTWPRPDPEVGESITPTTRNSMPREVAPIEDLEPESVRLARLRGESEVAPVAVDLDEAEPVEPPITPSAVVPMSGATDLPPLQRRAPETVPTAARAPVPATAAERTPKVSTAPAQASASCQPGSPGCRNERLATLDRMATGFFSQSMVHANAAKQNLLLSARNRSATKRSACRSDACVTEAYLRQMREISAIMEGRPLPQQ